MTTSVHIVIFKIRLYFEIHIARLCHHFLRIPAAFTNMTSGVMASASNQQKDDDDDIRSPVGNKSAVWKYF